MKWPTIKTCLTAVACALPAALHAAPGHPASTPCPETIGITIAPADTAITMHGDSLAALPPKYRAYLHRMERRRKRWNKLIPNQGTLQFAGSIGMFAAGPGWHYGRKDHWETELLIGIVPRYHSEATKMTLTAKQRYIPWHLPAGHRWVVEPLTAGVFFSSIFGEDFWAREPSRYPRKYYGFSTKVRANVFIGERVKYRIPHAKRKFHKSVSLYYELSTSDLYIVSALPNKRIKLGDILSLSVGARFEGF